MTTNQATLRTRLANGLTVIIAESHRAPVASFWIWYRVGSRNEVPGITGVSHWVEHMLFKGTPTWKVGEIFRTVNKHGGVLNGFTWLDYTAYFETLPASEITLALDIEADRMQNAIIDPKEVQSERTVILSEREGNENQPTFHLREEVNAAAFKAHPYGQGVIGFTSDLKQITRDDLYSHYRRYYVPNNATIILVGNVDSQAMLAEIEERFGRIPGADEPPAVRTVEPPQQGERRITVRRPAPAATMLAAWHAPAASEPDAAAMIVLDAILSGGKSFGFGGGGMGRSSRLYRSLVAAGLASSAGSSYALSIDPYLLSISATLVPDASPTEVETIVFNDVERLRTELVPEDELARAIKQIRAQLAYSSESVAGQGYWLGSQQMVRPDADPDEFIEQIIAVTPEEVRQVAQRYLGENQRTVGWLEPTDESGVINEDDDIAAARPSFFSDSQPMNHGDTAPMLGLSERKLTNQIRLISHYDPTSEAAVVEMRIRAGSVNDPHAMPGLARFTGQMLNRGTRTHTFAELNEELDGLGASIGVSVGREYVDVFGKSLKEDVGRLVELMAGVIREPVFPADEIERVRAQSRTALKQILNDSGAVASETLREMIYPAGHPYRHRSLGTEESLGQIQRDDLIRFHQQNYGPTGTIVATAGGVPIEQAGDLIQRIFGDWQALEKRAEIERPPVGPLPRQTRQEKKLPGKTQADVLLGLPTLTRTDPDYEPLRMANLILGRLGLMGRLGESVRERQGMAYHASSTLSAGLIPGLWIARAGVNPSNIDAAIDSILAEIERLRSEPVTAEELADAKSYLIGSLPLGLESSDASAGTALDLAFYDLGMDYIERLPGILADLTAGDLQRVAVTYILPDRLAIAVARPAEQA